jgi:hypothetical protein
MREALSQIGAKTLAHYQLFVVREPRDLVLVCDEPKLIDIFKIIQDA